MLDYDYHYPLTPIQSESHNIHPAFRNDPELASLMNINGSVITLVPPPRNPLRTEVKPLFSTTSSEVNTSTPSLVETLTSTDNSALDARAANHTSSRPLSACTSTSKTFHKAIQRSSGIFDDEETGIVRRRPDSQEISLRSSYLAQHQARPISTLAAKNLSSLPCPPSLLPQEWSLFLNELQNAASLSKGQKSIAIAVALAVPIPFPAFKGLIGLGVWRYQMTQNVRMGLENGRAFEEKRGRESVESVVERWNERWKEQRVRVNLEVRGKGKKARGEKGKFKVVVTKLQAPESVDEGYESEYGS